MVWDHGGDAERVYILIAGWCCPQEDDLEMTYELGRASDIGFIDSASSVSLNVRNVISFSIHSPGCVKAGTNCIRWVDVVSMPTVTAGVRKRSPKWSLLEITQSCGKVHVPRKLAYNEHAERLTGKTFLFSAPPVSTCICRWIPDTL